ncbi:MAG TPA: hypothetical protein VN689_08070, partial [Burkholderiales bacterium]|nr:hypothetical protein [Burkholderiales bacterium]
ATFGRPINRRHSDLLRALLSVICPVALSNGARPRVLISRSRGNSRSTSLCSQRRLLADRQINLIGLFPFRARVVNLHLRKRRIRQASSDRLSSAIGDCRYSLLSI